MNRPKIIVNAAMSVDGKIALVGGKRIKISDNADFMRVHKLRASVDAILVGINTVLKDDPRLTVKKKYVPNAKNPFRIVLDSQLRIPDTARVLNDDAPTIIATTERAQKRNLNAKLIRCGTERVNLRCLLAELYERGIKSVMVEGGGTVISSFLKSRLVDELYIFMGSIVIGGAAPSIVAGPGAKENAEIIVLKLRSCERLGYGLLLHYGVEDD